MQYRQRSFKILIFAIPILILLALFVAHSTAFTCWDFRNNLWGPAYLLTQNQSPYRVDQLFELGRAVWMPMVIGVFFPLGFLPLQQASNLWFVFNLIWFLLIIWISSGSLRPRPVLFSVALLLSLIFPPSVTHFWSGQVSILITLALLAVVLWSDKISIGLLAILITISLSKPQLAVLVLPGFIMDTMKKDGAQKSVHLLLYLMGCTLFFMVPLFVAYTDWFPDFIWSLQQNPSWAQPSTLHFLRTVIPNGGEAIWILLAILLFVLNMRLWATLPKQDAIYWSLALTPLMTPYIWTWDFVMLLPLFISFLFKAKTKISLGVLLGGYLLTWGLIMSLKNQGEVNESLFWWVPWMWIMFIIGAIWLENRFGVRANHLSRFTP
ncbi:MAG: DUF2029 domain-containing protein [Chloroflexota bacterium]|nr:DUF2029 domain-containing protein [Chloroflexota bacterium]